MADPAELPEEAPDNGCARGTRLRVEPGGRVGEFVVGGEIDLSNADDLRAVLESVRSPSLRIDLCDVRYLDSAGIAVLFDQGHKDLHLRVRADSAVAKVIGISGLTHIARVEFLAG